MQPKLRGRRLQETSARSGTQAGNLESKTSKASLHPMGSTFGAAESSSCSALPVSRGSADAGDQRC